MKEKQIPWTRFMDMHSGGGQKLQWAYIYIQASEEEAQIIFQNRFGRNPNRITCTCCGQDYSYREYATLEEATAYNRHCEWDKSKKRYLEKPSTEAWRSTYLTLEKYSKQKNVLIIPDSEIEPYERQGSLKKEGYTWIDPENEEDEED